MADFEKGYKKYLATKRREHESDALAKIYDDKIKGEFADDFDVTEDKYDQVRARIYDLKPAEVRCLLENEHNILNVDHGDPDYKHVISILEKCIKTLPARFLEIIDDMGYSDKEVAQMIYVVAKKKAGAEAPYIKAEILEGAISYVFKKLKAKAKDIYKLPYDPKNL